MTPSIRGTDTPRIGSVATSPRPFGPISLADRPSRSGTDVRNIGVVTGDDPTPWDAPEASPSPPLAGGPGLGAALDDLWRRVLRMLPWAADAVVVGVVGLFALADLAAAQGRTGYGLILVGGGSALTAVALRRGAPRCALLGLVAVLLVSTVVKATTSAEAVPPTSAVVALAAVLTVVVRRQPIPWAAGLVAAGAVATLGLLTWSSDVRVLRVLLVIFGGLGAAGVGVGIYLRQLDDRQAVTAEAARRDERLDLARELHDMVAHFVTGIVVQAQAARVVADRDPRAADRALEQIEGAGKDALAAMRAMVGSLRDTDGADVAPTIPPVGLSGLEDLAVRSDAAGLPVHLRVEPRAGAVARGAAAASTHRIVQESLTNVHRHAHGATRAEVDVRVHGDTLVVTVSDDGCQPVGGPDRTPPGTSFGLVGMAERAEALGGALVAGPAAPPDHGWRVQAWYPLDQASPT
ncbi:sensor histidine kinase [Iamia sp.]|uniref:sensor histidine kinase n=1 Tax=Iamia sp. TaxID=2722710 RepID=UPI002C8F30B0|nr:histidine kinase [Iamia sp.]HXH58970.1 histidine kinase [Iamia sp.]